MRDAGDWEEAAKALRWTSDRVSNGEYFNYKYLWMDEHTDAMFNRMRGNSLLFQTIGSFTHWMYPQGKHFVPWDHFIPINYNQSDLLEKLEWAFRAVLIGTWAYVCTLYSSNVFVGSPYSRSYQHRSLQLNILYNMYSFRSMFRDLQDWHPFAPLHTRHVMKFSHHSGWGFRSLNIVSSSSSSCSSSYFESCERGDVSSFVANVGC